MHLYVQISCKIKSFNLKIVRGVWWRKYYMRIYAKLHKPGWTTCKFCEKLNKIKILIIGTPLQIS